jgi:hypothetical protein
MKLKVLFASALSSALLLTSCSDAWLEEVKIDQNRPSDVPMNVLLPAAQASYGLMQGDVLPRLTSIFMQQMTGNDRQSLAHNRYAQIGEGDFDNPWGLGYSGGMYDLQLIMDKATEKEAYAYRGIAKIMTAMYLGVLTDHFGDIPYSEALQGAGQLKPAYDSQADIYAAIATLLQGGVADLATPSALSPGSDDLIHGGDLSAWATTATALGARYLNHLSKTSLYNPADVIAACQAALQGNVGAGLAHESSTNQNPWYQFTVIDRDGYIVQTGTMFDMMVAANDPRESIYRGDSASGYFYLPFYGAPTAELPFITEHEVLFILAEAQLASGDASAARTSLEAAISSNMNHLGVDAADAASYIAALPATTDLELIMNEKYIAMYTHVEAWTDWRRTGYPMISAPADANLNGIPRRMPYPEGEYLYNADNVPMPLTAAPDDKFGVTSTYRLWWDAN